MQTVGLYQLAVPCLGLSKLSSISCGLTKVTAKNMYINKHR